jgi:hypothetical protein
MFLNKAVATALVSASCITGLAACGGSSDKVSDSSFIDTCRKALEAEPSLKQYAANVCPCVQKTLEDKGLGDKDPNDKSIKTDVFNASRDCTAKEAAGGS